MQLPTPTMRHADRDIARYDVWSPRATERKARALAAWPWAQNALYAVAGYAHALDTHAAKMMRYAYRLRDRGAFWDAWAAKVEADAVGSLLVPEAIDGRFL